MIYLKINEINEVGHFINIFLTELNFHWIIRLLEKKIICWYIKKKKKRTYRKNIKLFNIKFLY